ncbi:putative transcription factor C3H family [Arabidopsis thaliana]
MNFTEATNVVHNRIHQLEPENASKIIGYLLLMQDQNDRDMIRLAFCPDSVMRSMINCVKCELAKNSHYNNIPSSDHIQIRKFGSFSGSSNQSLLVSASPPSVLSMGTSFWENTNDMDSSLKDNVQFLNFEDSVTSPEFSTSFFSQEKQSLSLRTSRRSLSLPEFPLKICHYFNKGFCKHGNNCRYFHGKIIPEKDSFAQMFNPKDNNLRDEEHVVSPGSLEKLEREIMSCLNQEEVLQFP